MIRRAPFTTPMRALRRAAWICAREGKLTHWDDPMPDPSQIPSATTTHRTTERSR